jgi:hypothetical protein
MIVNSGRRSPPAIGNELLGGMMSLCGGVLIAMVFMVTIGPWRERAPLPFPVHILDLQQPITRAERDAAKQSGH